VRQLAAVDDQRDARVTLDVTVLLAALAGAHEEDAVLVEVPDGRGVRVAARAGTRQYGDVRFREERRLLRLAVPVRRHRSTFRTVQPRCSVPLCGRRSTPPPAPHSRSTRCRGG